MFKDKIISKYVFTRNEAITLTSDLADEIASLLAKTNDCVKKISTFDSRIIA